MSSDRGVELAGFRGFTVPRYVDADPYPWPYNGDLRPENTVLLVIDMQTEQTRIQPILSVNSAIVPLPYVILPKRCGGGNGTALVASVPADATPAVAPDFPMQTVSKAMMAELEGVLAKHGWHGIAAVVRPTADAATARIICGPGECLAVVSIPGPGGTIINVPICRPC